MAGIEKLEVHSKVRHSPEKRAVPSLVLRNTLTSSQSYIVRWVNVEEGNTLSWSVQPHKKSM